MAHLTIYQNLPEIQKQYEEILQRPIYISGYLDDTNVNQLRYYNYFLRSSSEEEYIEKPFLFVYLSPFSYPWVKREFDKSVERDKIWDHELYRFCEADLSRQISFCFPLTELEKEGWKRYLPYSEIQNELYEKLKSTEISLRGGYTEVSVLPSDVEKYFPELVPYIYRKKEIEKPYDVLLAKKLKINNPSPDYNSEYCLAFAHSWCFETPQEKQAAWSYFESSQVDKTGYRIIDESLEFPVYTSLCPPGQYKSKNEQIDNQQNKDLCFPILFLQKPGKCFICKGLKNDRKHISFSKEQIERNIYQCYTCFQFSIKDWSKLLGQLEEYEPKNVKRI
jgi:hypothetical protein